MEDIETILFKIRTAIEMPFWLQIIAVIFVATSPLVWMKLRKGYPFGEKN